MVTPIRITKGPNSSNQYDSPTCSICHNIARHPSVPIGSGGLRKLLGGIVPAAVWVGLVTIAGCDMMSPREAGQAYLALQPTLDARSVGLIGIGGVRVTLTRGDGTGAIVAYEWTEGATVLASGATPNSAAKSLVTDLSGVRRPASVMRSGRINMWM